MSTMSIVRARRAAAATPLHTSCGEHEAVAHRYGDGETCGACGVLLVADTPGMVELDLDYANGVVDLDFYLEQRDALLGHP